MNESSTPSGASSVKVTSIPVSIPVEAGGEGSPPEGSLVERVDSTRLVIEVFEGGKLVERGEGLSIEERRQAHQAGRCELMCAFCYHEASEARPGETAELAKRFQAPAPGEELHIFSSAPQSDVEVDAHPSGEAPGGKRAFVRAIHKQAGKTEEGGRLLI